jgi:tetratricopeptide (TPR) repeat protein
MQLAEAVAREHPLDASAWHLLSYINSRGGAWQAALQHAERSLSLRPDDPNILVQYGQCLVANGRRPDALKVADRIISSNPDGAELNDALGTLLTHCEEPVRGRIFFERAVKLAPTNAFFLYNLATAQRMTGDLAGAEASLDEVIAKRPDDVRAYYMRSDLRTQSAESNHIEEMIRLLDKGIREPQREIMLCFAIAKELEDVGRYGLSFQYLKRGCDRQRRRLIYAVRDDIATIDRIIELHDATALKLNGGIQTDECIFVIGLPRSGTTLVERILARHSMVHGGGELQAFPSAAVKAVQERTGQRSNKLDFVRAALEVEPAALGKAYLEAAQLQRDDKPRLVDKLPMNYLYAGLIRRALPGARIIALARRPLDSCYAMYKTLFDAAYPFTYDLSDLGQYYAAWHRLMLHWRATLGDALLIVQYEDLVADPNAVARKLVAHCGLAWEDDCLGLYEQGKAVTTASAAQVRRPIYSSSVGLSRRYESELTPLANTLKRLEPPTGWRLAEPIP